MSWSTANADSAVVAGTGVASSDLSGSQSFTIGSPGSYAYAITASGAGGQATQSASVTAALPEYALSTYAVGDGSVSPGGVYPAATTVAISATAGGDSYFTGWTGSQGGAENPIVVTLNQDTTLYANFAAKQAQSIGFSPPSSAKFPGPPIALVASATSGLPVTLAVAGGPASLASGQLTLTGSGPVVVEATQPGNGQWLPAPMVVQTINVAPAPTFSRIRFNGTGRDARVVGSGSPTSGGPVWTDPAGLQSSPWPSFANPRSAAANTADVSLPPVPAAPQGIH